MVTGILQSPLVASLIEQSRFAEMHDAAMAVGDRFGIM